MKQVLLVDSSGRIYLPSSVNIPHNVVQVEVDKVPDIDLYLYHEGQFVLKSNAEQIRLERQNEGQNTALKHTLTLRRKAYHTQSDPLYMEWQFDQTPEKERLWRDKVTEIKQRYPLPA